MLLQKFMRIRAGLLQVIVRGDTRDGVTAWDGSSGLLMENNELLDGLGAGLLLDNASATLSGNSYSDNAVDLVVQGANCETLPDGYEDAALISSELCPTYDYATCGDEFALFLTLAEPESGNGAASARSNPPWRAALAYQDGLYETSLGVESCEVAENAGVGVFALDSGTSVSLLNTSIQDTLPNGDGHYGYGIEVWGGASLVAEACEVAGNTVLGVMVMDSGSSVTLREMSIEDTQPGDNGQGGYGIQVSEGATLNAEACSVRGNSTVGVVAYDSGTSVTLRETCIEDTRPDGNEEGGYGIQLAEGASLDAEACELRENASVGVLVGHSGTSATFRETAIEDTQPKENGEGGFGIEAYSGASMDAEACEVRGNTSVGVLALDSSTSVTLRDTRIATTMRGDVFTIGIGVGAVDSASVVATGIEVSSNEGPGLYSVGEGASLACSGCTLQDNQYAGAIVVVDGSLVLDDSTIEGTTEQENIGGGIGIYAAPWLAGPPNLSVTDTIIQDNAIAGVWLSGEGCPPDTPATGPHSRLDAFSGPAPPLKAPNHPRTHPDAQQEAKKPHVKGSKPIMQDEHHGRPPDLPLRRGPARPAQAAADPGQPEHRAALAAPGRGGCPQAVNGDGLHDILVGSTFHEDSAGAVYLVHSPVSGPTSLFDADAKLTGNASGDAAGRTAAVDDFDGDGFGDVLIGACGNDEGGEDAGAAYLFLGPLSGTWSVAEADLSFLGGGRAWAGYRISAGGDVNADGFGDFLLYAAGNSPLGGIYHVAGGQDWQFGSRFGLAVATSSFSGEEESDSAGIGLAAGDVDGDGFDDIMIGAKDESSFHSNAGAAYLVKGPVTGHHSLASAHAKLYGSEEGASAGSQISLADDVNGDGRADMFIGATSLGVGGGAYLQHGPITGEHDLGAASAVLYGYGEGFDTGTVALAGDIDQDGFGDLLVGAQSDSSGGQSAGAAYLVYGPVCGTFDLSKADARLIGEDSGDHAGISLSGNADIDGDGIPDMLVGARSAHGEEDDAGAVYLLLGGLGI